VRRHGKYCVGESRKYVSPLKNRTRVRGHDTMKLAARWSRREKKAGSTRGASFENTMSDDFLLNAHHASYPLTVHVVQGKAE